jgi:CRP/FNR family transcriptional regulator, anaerobic regulatory protein
MRQPDWIQSFPALERFPDDVRARLIGATKIAELPQGSRIFAPGHAPESFLLLDGVVRVQQVSDAGREIVLYRVATGETCPLTTACLLGYEEYQAEGIAETRVKAAAIPRTAFDDLIASSDAFRRFVFTDFSRRVTDLFRIIEEIAFQRIDLRLAQRLLQLADAQGPVGATHQQLANELGSAREVVSRQLHEFQRRGWIRTSRGSVEVADHQALARLARD